MKAAQLPDGGSYDALDEVSESINPNGGGLYSAAITRSYQDAQSGVAGRPSGFSVGTGYTVGYGYDQKGRLNNVTGPGLPAGGVTYERLTDYTYNQPVSDRVGEISYCRLSPKPSHQLSLETQPSCGGSDSRSCLLRPMVGRRRLGWRITSGWRKSG